MLCITITKEGSVIYYGPRNDTRGEVCILVPYGWSLKGLLIGESLEVQKVMTLTGAEWELETSYDAQVFNCLYNTETYPKIAIQEVTWDTNTDNPVVKTHYPDEQLRRHSLKEFKEFYKKKKDETEEESFPSKFRVFTTSYGSKVLVGKSAESNHELTFSFARPYDIFLHVKNAPGSHTILRVKDKNKFPRIEDIYQAAYYAAKFSKLKHSRSVPVSYALKRYVRGAKGLSKGVVIMEREKVVYVNPAG